MTASLPVRTQVDKRAVSLAESTDPAVPLTVQQVLIHVALIQQIMAAAMKEGEHYGRIPGCGDKPTLLKPGAEKLCLLFRLAPAYEVEERQLERGHREYRIMATLTSITTQVTIGQGVGSCSTMENKFRFRAGAAEVTDRAVPRAYWEIRQDDPAKAQELIGGKGFTVKKVDGQGWMVAKGGEKVETDNPADHLNTVLKMAKKRALVDAVLTATAASDIFTQDLEAISASIATLTQVAAPTLTPVTVLEVTADTEQPKSALDPAPAVPIEGASASPAASEAVSRAEGRDFRSTPIHFGKNRGLTLADLTPQQLHWYEAEWMPKKAAQGNAGEGDRALMAGLKAYREWREAEKQAEAGATARPPKRRRAATKAAETAQAA